MKPVVFVVDDDISVRESLELMIGYAGWDVKTFESARDFLSETLDCAPSCLVLDVHLPDLNGLELQQQLAAREVRLPIVFVTGQGDIPMTVKAMKAGAVEFLTKPFSDEELLTAIGTAIARSSTALDREAGLKSTRHDYASLSRRERQVMSLVVRGQMNKQIAAQLGISEITVKAHRGRMMRKMHVDSIAELVNVAGRLFKEPS